MFPCLVCHFCMFAVVGVVVLVVVVVVVVVVKGDTRNIQKAISKPSKHPSESVFNVPGDAMLIGHFQKLSRSGGGKKLRGFRGRLKKVACM